MNFRKLLTCLAPAALLMAASTVASAAPILANATFGFTGFGGSISVDPAGDLLAATTIHLQTNQMVNTVPPDFNGLPNDLSSLPALSAVLLSSYDLDLTTAAPTLTATFGPGDIYSFTAASQVVSYTALTHSVSIYILGTFSDSTGFYADNAASLSFSFTQAGNGSINGSATFATPPAPLTEAPEPASMALMGSALVGVGLIGRKKLVRR